MGMLFPPSSLLLLCPPRYISVLTAHFNIPPSRYQPRHLSPTFLSAKSLGIIFTKDNEVNNMASLKTDPDSSGVGGDFTAQDLDLLSDFQVSTDDPTGPGGDGVHHVLPDGRIGVGPASAEDELMDLGGDHPFDNASHRSSSDHLMITDDIEFDSSSSMFSTERITSDLTGEDNLHLSTLSTPVSIPSCAIGNLAAPKIVTVTQQQVQQQLSQAPQANVTRVVTLPSVVGRNVTGGKVTTIGTGGLVLSQTGGSSTAVIGSATQLSDFITSIKPPTIPGQPLPTNPSLSVKTPTVVTTTIAPKGNNTAGKKETPTIATPSSIVISSGTTQPGKVIALTAEQLAVALSRSGATTTLTTNSAQASKLIMTPEQLSAKLSGGGQKVILTSTAGTTGTISNVTPVNVSAGQQIVLLSPMKAATTIGQNAPAKTIVKTVTPAQTLKVVSAPGTSQKDGKQAQGVQIIKVIGSSAASTGVKTTTLRTIAPSPKSGNVSVTTASLVTAIGEALGGQKVTVIPASTAKIAGTVGTATPSTGTFLTTSAGQVIMIPANLLQGSQVIQAKPTVGQVLPQTVKIQVPATPSTERKTNFVPIAPSPISGTRDSLKGVGSLATANGHFLSTVTHIKKEHIQLPPPPPITDDASRQRKPCNCTKSQCLKLYCDCFANGEFCKNCNCNNCFNNLEHEDERQKAVRLCLERNPSAFHPKIGKGKITGDFTERRHTKGCNCRRSGCLKNYCECYEAKILCTELCKCCGCKNYEDSFERKSLQLMNLADAAEFRSAQQSVASKVIWGNDYQPKLPVPISSTVDRFPCSFITQEVIDAICQCLMVTAEDGEKSGKSYSDIEKCLISEFGRCLKQIIECANKAKT